MHLFQDLKRATLTTNFGFFSKHAEIIEQKARDPPFEKKVCLYCFDELANVVFMPCGHNVIGSECLKREPINECAFCKKDSEFFWALIFGINDFLILSSFF